MTNLNVPRLEVCRALKAAGWPQEFVESCEGQWWVELVWVEPVLANYYEALAMEGLEGYAITAAPSMGQLFAYASRHQMNTRLSMHCEAGASAEVWLYNDHPIEIRVDKVPDVDRPLPADALGTALAHAMEQAKGESHGS